MDGSVRLLNEAVAPLASVKSTYGNFYVTGMILLVYNISVSYKRLCHYQMQHYSLLELGIIICLCHVTLTVLAKFVA